MADTTRWTLQECADAAGQCADPAPDIAYVPPLRRCRGCGADLGERRTKGGLYLVYCGASCVADHRRRQVQHFEAEWVLTLAAYSW